MEWLSLSHSDYGRCYMNGRYYDHNERNYNCKQDGCPCKYCKVGNMT